MPGGLGRCDLGDPGRGEPFFFLSAPVAFRRVALPSGPAEIRTTTGSLSTGKTNAIPTEP